LLSVRFGNKNVSGPAERERGRVGRLKGKTSKEKMCKERRESDELLC